VQIANVPRHEVGHNLALAIRQELIAAGKSLKDQMHVIRPVTFVDQVLARTDDAGLGTRTFQNPPVLVSQVGTMLKLLDQRIEHEVSQR
jgi:hypothetical protein